MAVLIRWSLLGLLLALRLPSLVQPAGADQSLYTYIGIEILGGGFPYIDGWDQKPPGIHFIYALLWWIWPDERVVATADLVAATGVCWLLVVLGRRVASNTAGWIAACIFALLANPSMHRLSGVFVRAQCETFIALAITGALVLLCSPRRRRLSLVGAGVLLGLSVWLKYNAIVLALPLLAAIWLWRPKGAAAPSIIREWLWLTASTAVVGIAGLAWIASRGALTDLWLATFTYNVAYSSEGFAGPGAFLSYVVTLPFRQARYELLWLLGLAGVPLPLAIGRTRSAGALGAIWIGAAIMAIALNGRDLPQYFVQAAPALALAGALGVVAGLQMRRVIGYPVLALLLVVGLTRVGVDRPVFGVARLAGLPGLVENLWFDISHWRGTIDRAAYLDRFGGNRPQDKYSAGDVADMARVVANTTNPGESILVFGFSPGIYVKANRQSASRFFWSYPVVIEFAADRPRYGSRGLVDDLLVSRPALVILQKGDWAPDSRTFFMNNPMLSAWLTSEYEQAGEFARYVMWRRIPPSVP